MVSGLKWNSEPIEVEADDRQEPDADGEHRPVRHVEEALRTISGWRMMTSPPSDAAPTRKVKVVSADQDADLAGAAGRASRRRGSG